jgi:hypothetical protein
MYTPGENTVNAAELMVNGTTAPISRPSDSQVAAIRATVRLFAVDDAARGVSPHARVYCDACDQPRPAAGSINYERYQLCNGCAVEYEVARARGALESVGQYVRDKRFGDGERHAVSA